MEGSLLRKMPGPDWQKFANLRLLYSYMMCHPSKKLIFMGAELAVWDEWNCKSNLDWNLLDYAFHKGMFEMVRTINHYYLKQPALWANDFNWEGYEWIDFSDAQNSVISYLRKGGGKIIACVHNFTPQFKNEYWIRLKNLRMIQEVFNSDAAEFGGSNKTNRQVLFNGSGFCIALSPLATLIFEIEFNWDAYR